MEDMKVKALRYHSADPKGKLAVVPTKPYKTQEDLSLAYTPGVAVPSMEIYHSPERAYEYTGKGNLVAVISNGTSVLGLGNIGPLGAKPVMEGKGLLFRVLAGINVFDIEIGTEDVDEFVQTVKLIAPTFGGINLEDIKAPECFEIERRLREEVPLPLMHDDQHGTAIITAAALVNALEITGKKIGDIRVVVNGAGAAATGCARLYLDMGVTREHLVMCDSKGVINSRRTNLTPEKRQFVTGREIDTLAEALVDADVFLGVSKAGVLTADMVRTMAPDPVVFALANPDPEIPYDQAKASRPDLIFATGRSDYPNQVNNVIGFPYIFRGALDVRARAINEAMKIAAAEAIAALAREPVPDEVLEAYGVDHLSFGRDYLIPKPLDKRLLPHVSIAVARAAVASGVADRPIDDWEGYDAWLRETIERADTLNMCATRGER